MRLTLKMQREKIEEQENMIEKLKIANNELGAIMIDNCKKDIDKLNNAEIVPDDYFDVKIDDDFNLIL